MNIDAIHSAQARAAGHVRQTPFLRAPLLDQRAGRRVWIKPECLQITGSFKFRGAWSALSALSKNVRSRGVIAFSSGNHAQGVAHAAALHRTPATIIMPSDAPALKIANTKAYGAEVVLYDREAESREEIGLSLSEERGLTLIKPYDEPQVIAGQGTCGLEIATAAQAEGIETADVLVCCGGGGLTAGIALACAAEAPGLRVRPVEPKGFDDMARSLRSGGRERNNTQSGGLCDAILTPEPGEITFPIIASHCGSGLVVTDAEALDAMATAFNTLKLVAEPGGAVALAAALNHADKIEGEDVIVIISGGNVDPAIFRSALKDS